MSDRVPVTQVVEAYESYEELAHGLGFRVRPSALRQRAAKGAGGRLSKTSFSRVYAESHARRTAPAGAVAAISALTRDLAGVVRKGANGAFPRGLRAGAPQFLEAVLRLPEDARAEAADAVAHSPHSALLDREDITVEQFQALLKAYAKGQTIARSRLVEHLTEEARRRGVEMSINAIEERLRSNTKVRTVPACFAEIIAGLDDSFLTGLILIEEMVGETDPDQWLEDCRRTLAFRSHNAMHKAVAESADIKYEAVHKALTRPKKGRRIQARIRDVLSGWLDTFAKGGGRPAQATSPGARRRSAHAVAGAAQTRTVLMRLLNSYPNRAALCKEAAVALGVQPAEVRRFLANPDDRRAFSVLGLSILRRMLAERRKRALRISYLAGKGTNTLAHRLADSANAMWLEAEANPENQALRQAFRATRLQLIMAMKQRMTPEDWDTGEDDEFDAPDEDEALVAVV